jgi:hypothetical protein
MNIANYIDKFHEKYDQFSGANCLIFYQFNSRNNALLPDDEAYRTAREMEIDYNKMPCIVFFKNMSGESVLTYHLSNNLSKDQIITELRDLFNEILNCSSCCDNTYNLYKYLEKYIRKTNNTNLLHKLAINPLLFDTIGIFLYRLFSLKGILQ